MRSGFSVLVFAVFSGCIAPRSMTLGMMAAPLGKGTEVGVFSGVGYVAQTGPVISGSTVGGDSTNTQTQNRAFGAPSFEANVTKSFSDKFALNVHVSPAGLQPGLKWTVNKSRVAHFAILPAVAFGYGSVGSSDYVAQSNGSLTEVNPRATTSFTFLGGLKFLVSHRSGFYAGAGYDLVFHRSNSSSAASASVDRSDVITQTVTHQIMAAVGFSIAFGTVSLRPEIAFAVNPALSQTISTRVGPMSTGDVTLNGGFGWAILPGFSLAVRTPVEKPEAEETEDGEEPAAEQEEEDEEEAPKKRGPARKRTGAEDDEDKPRRRRNTSEDDEEPRKKRRSDDEFEE